MSSPHWNKLNPYSASRKINLSVPNPSNVDLKELEGAFYAEGVEGSWQEYGFALTEGETLAAVIAEFAATGQGDEDDEGIEVGVVNSHRVVKIVDSCGEKRTVYELNTLVLQGDVRHLATVDGSVLVVVETEADVGGWLDFGHETFAAGGMHLDREVLPSVDKLDKQRELVAKALIVLLSHETSAKLMNELIERLSVVGPAANNGLATFDARDFPAFAYMAYFLV